MSCVACAGVFASLIDALQVVPVPAADGSTQYLWIGNQWVTSQLPGSPRNRDLLYFTVLQFNSDGTIQQIVYSDTTLLSLP